MPKKYISTKTFFFFGDPLHPFTLCRSRFQYDNKGHNSLIEIIDYKMNLGLNIDESIYSEFEKKAKSFNVLFSYGLDFYIRVCTL